MVECDYLAHCVGSDWKPRHGCTVQQRSGQVTLHILVDASNDAFFINITGGHEPLLQAAAAAAACDGERGGLPLLIAVRSPVPSDWLLPRCAALVHP